MSMWREAARWQYDEAAMLDAPAHEPMKSGLKPAERKAPTQDQKKVRREIQRKTAVDAHGYEHDICANCGREVRETSDPSVPWVHCDSHNSRCDVSQPADAVMLQGIETDEAHPMYHSSAYSAQDFLQTVRDEFEHLQNLHPSIREAFRKGAPFAGYDDFDACVRENQDKDDPEAYCGYIKHRVEGSKTADLGWEEDVEKRRQSPPAKDWYTGDGEDVAGPAMADGSSDSSSSSTTAGRAAMERMADLIPGHRRCTSCGHTGAPVLADTGPACRNCGSYSLSRSPMVQVPSRAERGETADYPSTSKEPVSAARHEATQVPTNVASRDGRILINQGDNLRLPNGQTVNVRNVRRHETSRDHYYIDTDKGTTVVPWTTQFDVVPSNQRQEAMPNIGVPGGNFNYLPSNTQNPGASGVAPSSKDCPVCGGKGTLTRRGDKYICSRCGYSESYQTGSGSNINFSDNPQRIQHFTSLSPQTLIARRAHEVINQMKENPL